MDNAARLRVCVCVGPWATYDDGLVPLLCLGMVVVFRASNGTLAGLLWDPVSSNSRRYYLKAAARHNRYFAGRLWGIKYIVRDLLEAVERNRLQRKVRITGSTVMLEGTPDRSNLGCHCDVCVCRARGENRVA
jgi:hypothetical protein